MQYLVYPLELVDQGRASHYLVNEKSHSSADLVIKGLIYLEARVCFSVHNSANGKQLAERLHPELSQSASTAGPGIFRYVDCE